MSLVGAPGPGWFAIEYLDTPRFAGSGYGLVSLGVSGLSNLVRSPNDPGRGLTSRLVNHAEFTKDVTPLVITARFDGDDLVYTSTSDRSALVNMAGAIGSLGGSPLVAAGVAALGAGILMPAMSRARESAVEVKSAANVRMIALAMIVHAQENRDALPDEWADLAPYMNDAEIRSPYHPEGLEGSGYAIRTGMTTFNPPRRQARPDGDRHRRRGPPSGRGDRRGRLHGRPRGDAHRVGPDRALRSAGE